MPTIIYPYTVDTNYIFDSDKIEVIGDVAKIRRQKDTHIFNEDFTNDADFIYDSSKVEFIGGLLQQKDVRSADNLIYNNFNVDEDATWARGSDTGVLVGSASVSGGSLIIPSGSNNYLEYDATNNMALGNTGCIRIRYKPQYSGSPGINQYIFATSQGVSNIQNFVRLMHTGTNIRWDLYDSLGINIKTVQTGNTFNPVAGQLYEIEFNFDTTNGEYRLFIDGININGLQTSAPKTRNQTAGIIRFLKDYTSATNNVVSCEIEDFIIFDTVQHTSNYTPDWSNIPQTIYEKSIFELPKFVHVGTGFIDSLLDFLTVETGDFLYNIKVEGQNYKYWNGSAWVDSDGTDLQANDATTMNTNITAFTDVFGELEVRVKGFITNNSNTQSSIDNLSVDHLDQEDFYIDNPTIEVISAFRSDGLLEFLETSIKNGNDNIKHILKQNNDWYYYDGVNWVISNETYTQSNTASEIQANIDSFLTEGNGKNIKLRSFLHSDDGSTTPELDEVSITYDFSGTNPNLTAYTISGNYRDIVDDLEGDTIRVRPVWKIGDKVVLNGSRFFTETITSQGYFEIDALFETGNLPDQLEWRFGDKIYLTNFIDQEFIEIGELTVLWQNKTEIDYLGG